MTTLSALAERLLGVLYGVASKGAIIDYEAIAKVLGLNMEWANHRWQLRELLGEVADYSTEQWDINPAVLAVSRRDYMPSGRKDSGNESGFWLWAVEHGLDISEPEKLVQVEQAKCFKFARGRK
jgi:hypothetical protein